MTAPLDIARLEALIRSAREPDAGYVTAPSHGHLRWSELANYLEDVLRSLRSSRAAVETARGEARRAAIEECARVVEKMYRSEPDRIDADWDAEGVKRRVRGRCASAIRALGANPGGAS